MRRVWCPWQRCAKHIFGDMIAECEGNFRCSNRQVVSCIGSYRVIKSFAVRTCSHLPSFSILMTKWSVDVRCIRWFHISAFGWLLGAVQGHWLKTLLPTWHEWPLNHECLAGMFWFWGLANKIGLVTFGSVQPPCSSAEVVYLVLRDKRSRTCIQTGGAMAYRLCVG